MGFTRVFLIGIALFFISIPLNGNGSGGLNLASGLSNNFLIDHEPRFQGKNVQIPLKRVGKLFFIDVEIDGRSGNFLLDLGAANLVLNKTYFRDSYSDSRSFSGGIAGNIAGSEKIEIKDLNIHGLSFSDLEAEVFDLGSIENKTGVKILGLLGSSLFQSVEIEIDTKALQLRIYPLDETGTSNRSGSSSEIQFPFKTFNNVILIKAEVSGKKLVLSFDTGAEANVLDNQNHPKVLEELIIKRRVVLRGLGGEPSEVFIGSLPEMSIGPLILKEMNTILADLSSMSLNYGTRIDGMLGYDFYSRGILTINMKKGTMAFNMYNK